MWPQELVTATMHHKKVKEAKKPPLTNEFKQQFTRLFREV